MFFKRNKAVYELVKFSENENFRVTMLKNAEGYIVFTNNVKAKHIGVGGMVGMTKQEADSEYNKQCVILGIAKSACEED